MRMGCLLRRLMVLSSLTCNGIPVKELEQLQQAILQTYGYKHIVTLAHFERLGLLCKQQPRNMFPVIADVCCNSTSESHSPQH
jgi:hypothetical protein